MNKDRLLRLADHMERLPADQYDQGSWFEPNSSDGTATTKDFAFKGKILRGSKWLKATPKEGFCGTSACVLGHAALLPDMGLTLGASEYYLFTHNGRKATDELMVCAVDDRGDSKEVAIGAHAGEVAFDIPYGHADVLFGSPGRNRTSRFYAGFDTCFSDKRFHDVVTPQVVAAKLREYVATDGQSLEDIL